MNSVSCQKFLGYSVAPWEGIRTLSLPTLDNLSPLLFCIDLPSSKVEPSRLRDFLLQHQDLPREKQHSRCLPARAPLAAAALATALAADAALALTRRSGAASMLSLACLAPTHSSTSSCRISNSTMARSTVFGSNKKTEGMGGVAGAQRRYVILGMETR
ncbi:uncharacterized protein B0T23DRAFT_55718 [Neurospora hispaniola]|uniref:Uncharacterized protein n=1 Tax=Neurospora hispaniola TaxID=588809 RepID=A0AAJ0HYL2_9PEZI|nr:hypothetical protein B0T23DRAFT_55718 [Neurospora hispaniola]